MLHDALSVSLTVELAGTLEVVLDLLTAGLDPNFDPSVEGVSFTFLTGSPILGTFSDVLNRDIGNGKQWVLYADTTTSLLVGEFGSADIDLRASTVAAIPEPGTGLLLTFGLCGLALQRRRARKTLRSSSEPRKIGATTPQRRKKPNGYLRDRGWCLFRPDGRRKVGRSFR